MDTKQVFTQQGGVETGLKAERVQEPLAATQAFTPGLELHLKAERVQEPASFGAEANVSYSYEVTVNQLQPVTIELPLFVVTLHGLPAWGIPGGPTEAVPAAAGRRG